MNDIKTKPLISVLTSCYNSEGYIQRYIDTILYQTYENIELILINNGSTDKTEEIILNNKSQLENKCKKFIYIKHDEVMPIGASIDDGLKYFTGDYLTWPDSDDIIYPNCLEEKVNFLENNPQYDFCFNATDLVNENDLDTIIDRHICDKVRLENADLFTDLIFGKNVNFEPIATCIRSSAFLKINPGRNIYKGTLGQNWQILLPMAYHYKCGYIDKSLAKYVLRAKSECNKPMPFMKKNKYYYDILINTIKSIEMKKMEKLKYLFIVRKMFFIRYCREFFIRCLFLRQIKCYIKSRKGT